MGQSSEKANRDCPDAHNNSAERRMTNACPLPFIRGSTIRRLGRSGLCLLAMSIRSTRQAEVWKMCAQLQGNLWIVGRNRRGDHLLRSRWQFAIGGEGADFALGVRATSLFREDAREARENFWPGEQSPSGRLLCRTSDLSPGDCPSARACGLEQSASLGLADSVAERVSFGGAGASKAIFANVTAEEVRAVF
jgi:hypothetical protein